MSTSTHNHRIAELFSSLDRAERQAARIGQVEARFPWLRLFSFLVFLFGSYLALTLVRGFTGWGIAVMLLAAFVVITLAHRRVLASIHRYQVLAELTRNQIARASIDWEKIPPHFPILVSQDHPFDRDLLITGYRSLHHLLDSTSSTGGSQRLAEWLLDPRPEPEALRIRQQQIRELLALHGLRARLALDSALITFQANLSSPVQRFDSQAVMGWLSHTRPIRPLLNALMGLGLLALANIVLFLLNITGVLPAWWIFSLLLYLAIQAFLFRETSEVFGESYDLAKRLNQFRGVLFDLETYPFDPGSTLGQLCKLFQQPAEKPSKVLRRAGWIATAASLHNNPFLSLLLNLLVPWDLFFAYQLELLKLRLHHILPNWLETWYTLEALCALANFASLNPEYTFPTLLQEETQPIITAELLGHPLIPHETRVTNSYSINQMGTVILITGSNMSGKSTFLRTVGANLCLAYAGSVVCAASLKTLPFRLYASINVSDSLNDGISFFYAEVRRLKALLDALQLPEPQPLFFLIDEIFRGTNNRERRIGSESYLRALAARHGAGLISTHDLDLVRLSDEIPMLRNYHFREEVEGDRMVFDYRLHEGPSPTTNALRIMVQAGLPIDPIHLEDHEDKL